MDKPREDMTRVEKIWWRWTDPSILVREGLPERLMAYEHVMQLFAEIKSLQAELAKRRGEELDSPDE